MFLNPTYKIGDRTPLIEYHQDSPKHGVIRPVRDMRIEEFWTALISTQPLWRKEQASWWRRQ